MSTQIAIEEIACSCSSPFAYWYEGRCCFRPIVACIVLLGAPRKPADIALTVGLMNRDEMHLRIREEVVWQR